MKRRRRRRRRRRRGESFGQSQLWDYWLCSYRPVPCSPAGRGEKREQERGEKETEGAEKDKKGRN